MASSLDGDSFLTHQNIFQGTLAVTSNVVKPSAHFVVTLVYVPLRPRDQ